MPLKAWITQKFRFITPRPPVAENPKTGSTLHEVELTNSPFYRHHKKMEWKENCREAAQARGAADRQRALRRLTLALASSTAQTAAVSSSAWPFLSAAA